MAEQAIDADLLDFIRAMKDRQEIEDCLLRYTRGVDRHDFELMRSAYHDDAYDEHGVAEGVAADFCTWAIDWHKGYQIRHQHHISNSTIDLDGDTAHAETYYIYWGENKVGPPMLVFGRYVDRLEKRDGRWAIAHRVSVNEVSGNFVAAEMDDELRNAVHGTGPSSKDRGDVSYRRPLTGGKVAAEPRIGWTFNP